MVRSFARIDYAKLGNFGDCEPVGEGVSEMRVHVGAGYRVYFMREGLIVYLLLFGGDKSTQAADIKAAKKMAQLVRDAAKVNAAEKKMVGKTANKPAKKG